MTTKPLTDHRPAVRQWITALRRPGLLQAHGQLMVQVTADDADGMRSYCCLGVAEQKRGCRWERKYAVDVNAVEPRFGPGVPFLPLYDDETRETVLRQRASEAKAPNAATLRVDTMRWLGLQERDPWVAIGPGLASGYPHGVVRQLSSVNDHIQLPLVVIADVIEAQPFYWDGSYTQAEQTLDTLTRGRNVR